MKQKNKIFLGSLFLNLIISMPIFAIDLSSNKEVDKNKDWTIRFNNSIEFNEKIKNHIKIFNNKNQETKINILMGKDDNSIIIQCPKEGYREGEKYRLIIYDSMHNKSKKLKETINFKFLIKGKLDKNVQRIPLKYQQIKNDIYIKYVGQSRVKIRCNNLNKEIIYDLSKWNGGDTIDWETEFIIDKNKIYKNITSINKEEYSQVTIPISSSDSGIFAYIYMYYKWDKSNGKWTVNDIKFKANNKNIKESFSVGILKKKIRIDSRYFSGNNMYIEGKYTRFLDLKEAIKLGVADYDENGNPYLEDDYYPVVGDNLVIFKLDKDAVIYKVKFDDKGVLKKYLQSAESFIESNYTCQYCDIEINDGVINKIEEIYTP